MQGKSRIKVLRTLFQTVMFSECLLNQEYAFLKTMLGKMIEKVGTASLIAEAKRVIVSGSFGEIRNSLVELLNAFRSEYRAPARDEPSEEEDFQTFLDLQQGRSISEPFLATIKKELELREKRGGENV